MYPQLWKYFCFNQFLTRKTTKNISRSKRRNTNSHMRTKDAWEFIRTTAHLLSFGVSLGFSIGTCLHFACMHVVASASLSVLHITFHVLLHGWRLNDKPTAMQSRSVARSHCWTTVWIGTGSLSTPMMSTATDNNQPWKLKPAAESRHGSILTFQDLHLTSTLHG